VTLQDARRATIVLGLVLGLGASGCLTRVYTVSPPCPIWSLEAERELARLQERGDAPNLETAIGEQEEFCQALEPARGSELCIGCGCWLRRIL